MYTRYFGLKESPFSLAPDPRYLYLSGRHQEALAHLIYGVTEGGGFVQLTGDVGTGKTMLIRALLERLPENVDVALILYPILSVREFVCTICDELRIPYARDSASLKVLIDALNGFLLENYAKGRRTVLIIDEAQNLNREVLEQLRLLTNLETRKEKLLQILLIAQPELNNMLAQPDLRQLAQRVTARYSLKALFPHETRDYIIHRCRVAGAKAPLFSRAAMRAVHRFSDGVPRLINIICDRALLGTYARGRTAANTAVIHRAANQVGVNVVPRALWRPGVLAPLSTTTVLLIMLWQFWPLVQDRWYSVGAPLPLPQAQSLSAASSVTPLEPQARRAASAPADAPATGAASAVQVAEAERSSEPAQAPTIAELLADPQARTDTESALTALFAHWGLDYAKLRGATGCERAMNSGLQCLFQSGTWNNLRQLNRPAVIELIDGQGRKHHVLVAGLEGDRVASQLGEREYSFPIRELDRYWYGQYLMLWKPPLAEKRVLRRGMRGQSVVWLRNTLARYNRQPGGERSDLFDKELETEVKSFQRAHHLEDDGIVGSLTLIKLNSYDPVTAPPMLRKDPRARAG